MCFCISSVYGLDFIESIGLPLVSLGVLYLSDSRGGRPAGGREPPGPCHGGRHHRNSQRPDIYGTTTDRDATGDSL